MKKFLASRGVGVPWVGGARPWPSLQALPCRGGGDTLRPAPLMTLNYSMLRARCPYF
jgi:hypothetical protein